MGAVYQVSPVAVPTSTLTSDTTCVPAAQATGLALSRNLVSTSAALSWSLSSMFTNTDCRAAPTAACTIPT